MPDWIAICPISPPTQWKNAPSHRATWDPRPQPAYQDPFFSSLFGIIGHSRRYRPSVRCRAHHAEFGALFVELLPPLAELKVGDESAVIAVLGLRDRRVLPVDRFLRRKLLRKRFER